MRTRSGDSTHSRSAARAAAGDDPGLAWRLAWALTFVFDRRRHWRDLAAAHRTALEASERAADRRGQARAHSGLARACAGLGRPEDAKVHFVHALRLCTKLDDVAGVTHTNLDLALVLHRQGWTREALRLAQRALAVSADGSHGGGSARAHNSIGWYQAQLGYLEEAEAHCRTSQVQYRQIGNTYGEASLAFSR